MGGVVCVWSMHHYTHSCCVGVLYPVQKPHLFHLYVFFVVAVVVIVCVYWISLSIICEIGRTCARNRSCTHHNNLLLYVSTYLICRMFNKKPLEPIEYIFCITSVYKIYYLYIICMNIETRNTHLLYFTFSEMNENLCVHQSIVFSPMEAFFFLQWLSKHCIQYK